MQPVDCTPWGATDAVVGVVGAVDIAGVDDVVADGADRLWTQGWRRSWRCKALSQRKRREADVVIATLFK